MQKQLSKKSHKATQSSIDDFMKHIRKYNLQSERYISPKPLLYMYSNPSRQGTLHTLQKSRSKSKTLSNRQHSNSKKSSSKTMRQKVQKMLSITKRQNIHKKSLSSISNKNERSIKKLNKSTAQVDLTKSKHKLKSKLNEFKLKPMTTSGKKTKKSKSKLEEPHIKLIQTSPIRTGYHDVEESQLRQSQVNKQNPAQLIEVYSKKLFKVQLYLQANKNKLGSMLCRKFQQILNQIVQSLVQNLKKSLNQLEIDIENRLSKQFQKQFDKSMMEKQQQLRTIKKVCEKITKKFGQLLHKQHYSNSLIYNLRLRGIDIDNEFGRAVWGVQNLGGLGYPRSQESRQEEDPNSSSTHRGPVQRKIQRQVKQDYHSSSDDFQFRQHPNSQKRKQQQDDSQEQVQKREPNFTLVQRQKVQLNTRMQNGHQTITKQQKSYEFLLKEQPASAKQKKSI